MTKFVFRLIWRSKFEPIENVIGFSIACNNRQTAHEKAFEKAMTIHKNMCMKDKKFSSEWYYSGMELLYAIPNYDEL